MKLSSAFIAVSCALVASTAFCGEPRGIQTSSFPVSYSFYAPCLGDVLTVTGTIYVRSHVFETNSGVLHIVNNWYYDQFASSASGREWFNIGNSPYQANIRLEDGLVENAAVKGHFKPLTDDTPGLFMTGQFKMTVNANGEVVVQFETGWDFPNDKCVGPKN